MQIFSPQNKDTFLILSFFLLLHFYQVKENELNKYIFITATQQPIKYLSFKK